MLFQIEKKGIIISGVLIIAAVISALAVLQNNPSRAKKAETWVELKEKDEEWEKYRLFPEKITKIIRKTDSIPSSALPGNLAEFESLDKAVKEQLAEINRIFRKETETKLLELKRNLGQRENRLNEEKNKKLADRRQVLNEQLLAALQQKEDEQSTELALFRQELEVEKKVALVNLQLQLSMSEIYNNPVNLETEKERIKRSINDVRREITEKIRKKETLLAREYRAFRIARETALAAELKEYQEILEQEYLIKINDYQNELEYEIDQWQNQRKKEIDEGIKLRLLDEKSNPNR